MRLLVMGGHGMLGSRLYPLLDAAGHEVLRQGRDKSADYSTDPTSYTEVKNLLDGLNPDAVLNLNALTDVDACEKTPADAYFANCRTAKIIAKAASYNKSYLIHVSTDQVYSGPGPHTENEAAPCNVYGLSKYCGELHMIGHAACVLRTNFIGRSFSPSSRGFSDWIVSALGSGQSITLFDDVFFSALHVNAVSDVVVHLLRQQPNGVFNLGSRDSISKAQFALDLAQRLALNTASARIGQIAQKGFKATRPLDMSMSVSTLETELGWRLPTMAETLTVTARDYENAHDKGGIADGC